MNQTLLRDTIQEQNEATRVGLQFLQISANKMHLEALYQDQMNELTRVTEEYEQGQFNPSSIWSCILSHI